jgi:hypothetical protein
MKYIVVFGYVAAAYGLIRLGLYFGYRWVDKMLCLPEPIDPSKPIVRPHPR